MRGRARELLIACSAALLAASCTIFVDTDGLSSAAAPGGGAADSGTGDGTIGGGGDAAPADGSAPGLCDDPSLAMCETFDTPSSLARYPSNTDPTTSIATDDAVFASAPRAARFEITSSGNGSPDATITLVTTALLTDFVFEGRIHVAYGEPVEIARYLHVTTGGKSVHLASTGALLDGTGLRAQLGRPPFGQWTKLRLEIRASTTPPTAVLSIGSVTSPRVDLEGPWPSGQVQVRLGVSEASSPTRGWLVRWDDVTVAKL